MTTLVDRPLSHPVPPPPGSVADVTEALLQEYEGRLDLWVVSRAVLDACRESASVGLASPPPVLVEALARRRLRSLLAGTVHEDVSAAPR